MIYLKKASRTAETGQEDVHDHVAKMLAEIAAGGEEVVRRYASEFDNWAGDIIVSGAQRAAAADLVPEKLKADIQFAHRNIRRFAEAQRATMTDCEIEILPGLIAMFRAGATAISPARS
jgi:sulfopropanediol 3-dehydrogenase